MGGRGATGQGKGAGKAGGGAVTVSLPTGVKRKFSKVTGLKLTFSNVTGLGVAKTVLKSAKVNWDDSKTAAKGTAFYNKGKLVGLYDKDNKGVLVYS